MLLLGCAACSGSDDNWLTVQLVGGKVVLTIGGQCGADSYLRRVAASSGGTPLWAAWRASPTSATPTVTVGSAPPGFTEETPLGTLSWPLTIDVKTNFQYAVNVPFEDVAGGSAAGYSPQPVFNELSSVHPPDC